MNVNHLYGKFGNRVLSVVDEINRLQADAIAKLSAKYAGLRIRVWNDGRQIYVTPMFMQSFDAHLFVPVISYTSQDCAFCEIDWH